MAFRSKTMQRVQAGRDSKQVAAQAAMKATGQQVKGKPTLQQRMDQAGGARNLVHGGGANSFANKVRSHFGR